jgi:hypothetical protein
VGVGWESEAIAGGISRCSRGLPLWRDRETRSHASSIKQAPTARPHRGAKGSITNARDTSRVSGRASLRQAAIASMHAALWVMAGASRLPTLLRAAGRGRGRQRCLDTFLYSVSPTSNGEDCCSTSAKDKLRPFQVSRKPVDFSIDSIAYLALLPTATTTTVRFIPSESQESIPTATRPNVESRSSISNIENNNPASPDAAVLLRCTHVPPHGYCIARLRAQPFSAIVASLRAGLVAASRSQRRPCPSRLIDRGALRARPRRGAIDSRQLLCTSWL